MPETPPSRMTRVRGWFLVILGTGLAIALWMIRAELAPGLSAPGARVDGSTFTGTGEQGTQILWLLNVVFVLSVAFVVNGLSMAVTGRTNRLIQGATLVLVIVAAVALYMTNEMLGPS